MQRRSNERDQRQREEAQAEISDRGAGMAQAGACWRDAGVARRAGHVARVLRCAGCHGLRKVCERALAKMRGLAGKESGVFGRDAWHGRSRAGEEAGGATGCGGLRAWGRAGLAQAARDAGTQRG